MSTADPLVEQIAVREIHPNPRNPRRRVKHIEELAESIDAHGLLQPLLVRPRAEGGFELVAGHRRHAALQHLGWETASVIVRDIDDEQAYVLALVENLQREDLSPHDEADALAHLVRTR